MLEPDHLRKSLEFETLFSDLSSRFINLCPGEFDREITDAMRRISNLHGIDVAVLWQWSSSTPAVITPTHIYAPEGMQPPVEWSQNQFPWIREQMLEGRKVRLSSLEELPAEAAIDREVARLLGIKSNLCLPLAMGGDPPLGALAFNTLQEQCGWQESMVRQLELFAQIFANALLRRRHDLKLQESEARLTAGTDLAGLAFYEVSFDEGDLYADDQLHDICGIPSDQREGFQTLEFWLEHLHPDDRPRVLDLRRQLHDGEVERLNIEYRYVHPTQGEKWIHHIASASTRDAAGRTVKSFGVLRDITERRRREEALRQSNAELTLLKERLQAESDYLKAEIKLAHMHEDVIGQSSAIKQVLHQVEQVAPTGSSVLLYGETGTGKELVARAIHRLSPRRSRLMVKVNCAVLPSGLVESELFGREKGAFTGAMTRQIGRFEVADGSTILLDEIGELSLEIQAKLLRVLEQGEFERLGNPRTIKTDIRMIAATNRDLAEDIQAGRFREDLFYRLNVFPIRVPPLRERPEDIPLLVWAFVEEFSARMGKKITKVAHTVMDELQRRAWPGNVRELRNVIEHAAILSTGPVLTVPVLDGAAPAAASQTMADVEREHILRTLERAGWRIKGPQGAAVVLGLKPSTLYSRMKKLGISPRQADEI
ncbi:sigma 54-interacting transcriptional regulator [Candidatus Moduliflexota bacterium]